MVGDSEATGSTGGTSATTSMPTTSPTTGDSTTTDPSTTDVSTTDATTTTSVDDTTTGEPSGTCVGLTQVSTIATVFEADGGDIGPDPACNDRPSPCGGDLVGTWSFAETCGFESIPNPFEAFCPRSTFTWIDAAFTGSLAFAMEGSFVQDSQSTIQYQLVMDVGDCFGLTCEAWEAAIESEDGATADCNGPDEACDCLVTSEDTNLSQGTFEVMGEQVTLTVDGDSSTASFCVDGDRFDLWQPIYDFEPTNESCNDEADCQEALGEAFDAYVCDIDDEAPAFPGLRPRWAR